MYIKKEVRIRVNKEIRTKEVRLIDVKGEQKGIFSREKALVIAQEKGLDLVEVAPEAHPPVCRIMDYEKFRYEQKKQRKKNKKKQVSNVLKEIRLSYTIGEHDFEVKVRNVYKFLGEGYRVKVSLRFKGREMIYKDRGKKLLERVSEEVRDVGRVEIFPTINGRNAELYLIPRQDKVH